MAISKEKERLTVTLETNTIKALDMVCKASGRSRSTVVDNAITILVACAIGKAQVVSTEENEGKGENKDEVN